MTSLGLAAALNAANLAQRRSRDARIARAKEREQTELAEQRLYDVRMNLVQRYWEDYNGALLQQGLDEQLPVNQGGIDRRGLRVVLLATKAHLGARHPQGAHAGLSTAWRSAPTATGSPPPARTGR